MNNNISNINTINPYNPIPHKSKVIKIPINAQNLKGLINAKIGQLIHPLIPPLKHFPHLRCKSLKTFLLISIPSTFIIY
mgnify:CR=1 FL=1